MSEHIRCIALAGGIAQAPLVLPEFLAKRGYVRHELDRLGVETRVADSDLHIETATVLRKHTPLNFWKPDEVAAYRKLFGLIPATPEPGSVIYLSRAGVTSEQIRAERSYRSDEIAEVVRHFGGTVVETASMRIEDFAALADKAETVIGDHGAAMFNMMQWRPKRIIEVVTDNWWSSCFVHLGLACDVAEHIVLRCNHEAFIKRLETVIAEGVILPENEPAI
ncbi:MAG: glycosyltransferase 61 family protein [Pseudomonadota bacterium]